MGIESAFIVGVAANAAWFAIQAWLKQTHRGAASATGSGHERSHYDFRCARRLLKSQRKHLAVLASQYPAYRPFLHLGDHIPLLCQPQWIPAAPVLLMPPADNLSDDSQQFATKLLTKGNRTYDAALHGPDAFVARTFQIMPEKPESSIFMDDYVEAIENVPGECPTAWDDRPSYRFLGTRNEDGRRTLTFMPGQYFDYQRSCEVLCYELAYYLWLGKSGTGLWESLSLRKASGDWQDFTRRHSIAGVNNLTIVHWDDGPRFLMMKRGTGKDLASNNTVDGSRDDSHGAVASAMGAKHVIPAGEFQPAANNPVSFRDECTLWFTLIREFAEEICLMPEAKHQGTRIYEFETMAPFDQMISAARAKPAAWRTYYLGVAIDPLSLKTEIMTATVIRQDLLRRIFEAVPEPARSVLAPLSGRELPERNSEGEIEGHNIGGLPLTGGNLMSYIEDNHILPAAAGCLELVRRNIDLFR